MAVDTMKLPAQPGLDPDIGIGEALMAQKRRERIIMTVKIGIVWVMMIVFMAIILLQFNFDPAYMFAHYQFVLAGLSTTILLSVLSIALATILALLGAVARLSHNSIALGISGLYVSIFRGTPLLVQIFIIYNGLPMMGAALAAKGYPQLQQALTLNAFQTGILALSLNYGAYMTEIFRAGIQSISGGQREAAESIGMSRIQVMRRVILPQAIRVIIPDIGNQFIAMQKDSAQVSVMGVWEMTFRASRFARVDSKFMEMYIVAAFFYWALTIVSSWGVGYVEKRMRHAYER
ncbi:MAG: amino acid ABC transporter permease [Anaerolineales bacterium]|nr:amino acid ABC transporter permease [Anaerolineae bacterium]PWB54604.1 MAG: amino acid ABC transporter permease [Anaerolineales bacterium]